MLLDQQEIDPQTEREMPLEAPAHLSEAAKAWIRQLEAAYELEPEKQQLALTAANALDRAETARQRVESDGAFIEDRFGQVKPHPGVAVERDARAAFVRTVRALDLAIYTKPGFKAGA
jgi:phage terminase small subunit